MESPETCREVMWKTELWKEDIHSSGFMGTHNRKWQARQTTHHPTKEARKGGTAQALSLVYLSGESLSRPSPSLLGCLGQVEVLTHLNPLPPPTRLG